MFIKFSLFVNDFSLLRSLISLRNRVIFDSVNSSLSCLSKNINLPNFLPQFIFQFNQI